MLYLTFKTEQDSFVNQYYGYLKQNNVKWGWMNFNLKFLKFSTIISYNNIIIV